MACQIRANTPLSFLLYGQDLGLFGQHNRKIKDNTVQPSLMPMYPGELLFLLYNSEFVCPNIDYHDSSRKFSVSSKSSSIKGTCCFCPLVDNNSIIFDKLKYGPLSSTVLGSSISDIDISNINYKAYEIRKLTGQEIANNHLSFLNPNKKAISVLIFDLRSCFNCESQKKYNSFLPSSTAVPSEMFNDLKVHL